MSTDATNKKEAVEQLRQFLAENEVRIIEQWRASTADDDEMQRAHHLTRDQFVDHMPKVLELLDEYLSGANTDQEYFEKKTSLHGHRRWKQGFSLEELINDWGHLKTVLLMLVEDFFRAHQDCTWESRKHCLYLLASFTNRAISASVREYDQLRQAEAASLEADLQKTRENFEHVLKLRSQLLHNFTHDLRGSLSGVTGASAVLEKLVGDDAMSDQARQMLASSVDNVREMLDDLLDLARLESGREQVEFQETDVTETVGKAVEGSRGIAESKGLEVALKMPDSLIAPTDPTALRRILQNLITNALEYTEEGTVTVGVAVPDDRHWELTVSDTGPGIQISEGVPLAFQLDNPHTRKDAPHPEADPPTQNYQGEGIGLTIVKRLCELLGANIRFDSEPQQGSTFTILFPLRYPDEE